MKVVLAAVRMPGPIRIMRLVVRAERAKGAAFEALQQPFAILRRAQGRNEMIVGTKLAGIDVREIQIRYRHVGRDRDTIELGPCHHAHGTTGREAAEMGSHPGLLNESEVPRNGYRFRCLRYTREAKAGRHTAFVKAAARRQRGIVRMQEYG